MAEAEQLPLPIKVGYKLTKTPFVCFKIAGRGSVFTVDTGTPFTSVSRCWVERWGLADAIQPCDDEYYEGVVFADIIYDSDLCCPEPGDYTACCTIAKNFCFYIRDCDNLLGLDFLLGTRSDLNLDINKPTLCIYQHAKPVTKNFVLMMMTSINGVDMVTKVDTGFCDFLTITEEEVKSLRLQMEKLDEPEPYKSQSGVRYLYHVAKDVRVTAEGKTVTATASVQDHYFTMVGMGFLMGATFLFEEDGLWILTFPDGARRRRMVVRRKLPLRRCCEWYYERAVQA